MISQGIETKKDLFSFEEQENEEDSEPEGGKTKDVEKNGLIDKNNKECSPKKPGKTKKSPEKN